MVYSGGSPRKICVNSYRIHSKSRSGLITTLIAVLGRTVQQSLHGQLDATLFVRLQHLDLDDLALGQVVRDLLDALVGDLADVQQAILAGQQVDQSTEVQNLGDRAFVDLANFNFSSDLLDAAPAEAWLQVSSAEVQR